MFMRKIMIDESEQIKEVYAYFGLAIYTAQVLEHQIVNMFVATKLHERHKISREDVDAIFDERFSQTMGKLIKDLKTIYKLSDTIIEQLDNALKTRNMLIHRYFREKVTQFSTIEGRLEMVRELDKVRQNFEKTDKILTEIYIEITRRHGVTQEMVDKALEDLLSGKEMI
jgi:hypothetical protein